MGDVLAMLANKLIGVFIDYTHEQKVLPNKAASKALADADQTAQEGARRERHSPTMHL
jgi:hypothetical protein